MHESYHAYIRRYLSDNVWCERVCACAHVIIFISNSLQSACDHIYAHYHYPQALSDGWVVAPIEEGEQDPR